MAYGLPSGPRMVPFGYTDPSDIVFPGARALVGLGSLVSSAIVSGCDV